VAGNALAAANENLLGKRRKFAAMLARIILMKLYFQRDPQEAFV
jgi:hypothetical protein